MDQGDEPIVYTEGALKAIKLIEQMRKAKENSSIMPKAFLVGYKNQMPNKRGDQAAFTDNDLLMLLREEDLTIAEVLQASMSRMTKIDARSAFNSPRSPEQMIK